MKRLLIYGLVALSLHSCIYGGDDDESISPVRQSSYKPITVNRDQFAQRVVSSEPIPIEDAGKIYIKDDLLFINEKSKGVHIFNNLDPENPVAVGFIAIDGNTDISIQRDVIYAHHARDLIALRFNATTMDITETQRIPDVFPPSFSPDGFSASYFNVPEDQVIVGYELIDL